MGAAHSQAWRTAPARGQPARCRPVLAVLCGRDEAANPGMAAERYGFGTTEATDWRALLDRDDVQLIDVCTPGNSHAGDLHRRAGRGQARAVREADGQHGGRGGGDGRGSAERAWPAASAPWSASTTGGCFFTIALARQLVAAGRIGTTIRHVRASYLQDWLADPAFPLTWRLQREQAYPVRWVTWAAISSTWPST